MNYEFKMADCVLSCAKGFHVSWMSLWGSQSGVKGYRYSHMKGYRWGDDILYKISVPTSKLIKALVC